MSNTEGARVDQVLTPRQDRLEAEIVEVLRAGGTRSSLKVLVQEFADYSRIRGTSAEGAVSIVERMSQRAGPAMAARGTPAVGDSVPDRLSMMKAWLRARYHRAD
jgi:hypothetical protein